MEIPHTHYFNINAAHGHIKKRVVNKIKYYWSHIKLG